MGFLSWLFGGDKEFDLDEFDKYIDAKLDEAADWRDEQYAELEARKQTILKMLGEDKDA